MSRQKDFQMISLTPSTTELVYVGHVTDPDNFYVQLERTADSLDEIMSLMQTYYKDSSNSSETLAASQLATGVPCAALFTDGEWYRARITGLLSGGMVEVLFVDFGNTDIVSNDSVRVLRPDLYSTPMQSFRCRLQGVCASQDFWSPQHVAQFEDSVLEKSFTTTFLSFSPDTECYSVELVDESGVSINKKFAELTRSVVAESSANAKVKRSVQAMGELDLKVTVQSGAASPSKPRGIAHALGVSVSESSPSSNFPAVPPVSLKVGENTTVSVVYVSTPSEFWCHVKKYSEQNDRVTEDMMATYGSLGPGEGLLRSIRPGCVCAALFDADSTWYRATVEKMTGREVSVYFLDYGNTETVSASNIRELREEFRNLPAQAVKCSLSGVAPSSGMWTEEAAAAFEEMVLDKEFVATIVSKEASGSHGVSLFDSVENSDVASSLINNQPKVVKGDVKSVPKDKPSRANVPCFAPLPVHLSSKSQVFLSWVNTPGDFYVQLASNQSVLDALTDGLQEFYNSPRAVPISNVQPGMMVVAKFSEDNAWYRGVVQGVTGNIADVEFVDFGNSDKVEVDGLRQLDKQFSNIPALAAHCGLAGVRPLAQGQTWSGDAKDFLEGLTEHGATCQFVHSKGNLYEVELEVEGNNVAKEMIAHAVVRGASEPPSDGRSQFERYQFQKVGMGQPAKVYMAFADSVESFFVQLSSCMQELDSLMAQLEAHYSSSGAKPLVSPQVGMPCVARYEEDGMWYRAQIRAFTARDVDVFFVDYGNTQVAPKDTVYLMESPFMSLAAQAIHCSLDIKEARDADSQLKQFNTLTGDEELDMVVKSQAGCKLIIDLLKNGASVTAELKGGIFSQSLPHAVRTGGYTPAVVTAGQTVQAYASFLESPSTFWIQLTSSEDELDAMRRMLSQHYKSGTQPVVANPSPGQPCCALYAEDRAWYRATILSIHGQQIRVQFVDYGNAELVNRENVKVITPDFISKPCLAIECCLDGFQPIGATDKVVAATETLLAEKEITVTFVGGKNVKVIVDGADAGKVLYDQGFGGQQRGFSSPKSPPAQNPARSAFGSHSPLSAGKTGGGGFGAHSPPTSISAQNFKDCPPPSGTNDAIITHVEDETGLFFVQLLSAEKQLEQLSSKLQSIFTSGGRPLPGPPTKDMACGARFSADGCWYRAKIENVMGSRAKVQFVDYGNFEIIQVSTLKALSSDFLSTPVQAFPCHLKGLKSWTKQTAAAFAKSALDVQVKVRFVSSSSPFDVQISANGQDVLQLVPRSPVSSPQKPFGSLPKKQQQSFAQPRGFRAKRDSWDTSPSQQHARGTIKMGSFGSSPQQPKSPPQKPSLPQQVYQPQKMPSGEQIVYVSHVSEDGTFYLQLSQDAAKIDEITEKLESLAIATHPRPVVGAACAAKFSEDGAWYRAIIKTLSGASAEVMFVDFGNGETCAVSSMKPLTANLLTPANAYHCQLVDTGPLASEQLDLFKTTTDEKELVAVFGSGNPVSVSLLNENGRNLTEILFPSSKLRPQTVPQEPAPGLVCCMGDNGQFYVHFNKDKRELLLLGESIRSSYAGEMEKLDSFEKGQICCAKSSEDGAWYRAEVLEDCGDSAPVIFVDYGKTEMVSKENLWKLLPGLTRPALAFACRLQGVVSWTEEQKKKFVVMTDGKTINVRFLTSKPPYEVELTRSIGLDLMEENGDKKEETEHRATAVPAHELEKASLVGKKSFSSQKPPVTGSCIVSHVDIEGKFFLQLTSEDEARGILAERLQRCELSEPMSVAPTVDMACCARYSSDEAWYRAVVEKVEEDSVLVRFVDFGNTDHVPPAELRNVSESLMTVPLAYLCVLEGCESVKDEVSEKLEDITADQTLTVTLTSPTQQPPYFVQLQFEDGSSVAAHFLGGAENDADAVAEDIGEERDSVPRDVDSGLASGAGTEDTVAGKDQKSVALLVGSRQEITVCEVVSPSLFYAQLKYQQLQLSEQANAMSEHYSALAERDGLVESPAVGHLCASQFGDNGSWYRACVKSIDQDSNTCTLFYIDYGNTDTVALSSIRHLLPEFEALPWQSVPCQLAGVRCQGEEWSEEVKAAFVDLVAEKSLQADVIAKDGKEGPYLVHLLDLGISVAMSLLSCALPGMEAVDVVSAMKHVFSSSVAEDSVHSDSDEKFEDTVQDVLGDGGENEGCLEKRTVDELGENEMEFLRQLNQRTGQLESTMLDEHSDGKVSPQELVKTAADVVKQKGEAVVGAEAKAEDEEDFRDADGTDAVQRIRESQEEVQANSDTQAKFSCVSDRLAELEWMDVCICLAESPTEFWCQLLSAKNELAGIGAASVADQTPVQDPQVGHVYLVCDPPNNFRARVLTFESELNKLSVMKVDSGKVEEVEKDRLYLLTNEQLNLPAQAFQCCSDYDSQAKHVSFSDLITQGEICDHQFQLKVVGRKADGTLLVHLRGKDSSLLPKDEAEETEDDKKTAGETSMDPTLEISQPMLQSTVLGDTTICQSRIDKSGGDRDYSGSSLEAGREYEVSATRGGAPSAFHLTLVASQGVQDALADDIAAEMAEKPDDLGSGESLAVGSPCLVQDSVTSSWLRGQVKSISGDTMKVLCVDTGACVEVGRSSVHELPSRFLDPPAQAVLCSLADVIPVDGQWCENALSFFTDFTLQSPLCAYICRYSADNSLYLVTLLEKQTPGNDTTTLSRTGSEPSLNRTLVELGYAEAVAGSALDVELQLERTINDLEKLEQFETSFTEVSCQRENSIGDVSGSEDEGEKREVANNDLLDEKGDAARFLTEHSQGKQDQEQPIEDAE